MLVEGTTIVSGLYVAKKILGPTLDTMGEDLKRLYVAGRDRVFSAAERKIENLDDGQRANLRTARDVLWHGAVTEDAVSAEYYGGLLAASRSSDGQDDTAIPFVNAIKSLSRRQLKMHFDIYWSLEQMMLAQKAEGNLRDPAEVRDGRTVCIAGHILISAVDLRVLEQQDLVGIWTIDAMNFETAKGERRGVDCISAQTTMFGVMLYAAAHNKLHNWHAYGISKFGDFAEVEPPDLYGSSKEEYLKTFINAAPWERPVHKTGATPVPE